MLRPFLPRRKQRIMFRTGRAIGDEKSVVEKTIATEK